MKSKKVVWNVVKVLLSIAAFYFAYTRIDFSSFSDALSKTKPLYVILGFICYVASQIVSSKRLLMILKQGGTVFNFYWNLRLYFLGMAYNLFLPGGVGGDAYKMFAYSRKSDHPTKHFFLPLIGDRLIGLVAICILLATSILLVPNTSDWWNNPWWTIVIGVGLAIGYYAIRRWFPVYLKVYFPSTLISLVIQIIQIAGILLIAKSVGIIVSPWVLISIFLISTIATAIPVFLGGLGAREVVFAALFPAFGLSSEQGVLIAVLFSITVIVSSIPGLFFTFEKE